MKKFVVILLFLLTVAVIVDSVPQGRQEVVKLLSDSECNSEVTYRLGVIDPKFGFDQEEVAEVVLQASNLWNDKWHKPIFKETETAKLAINFVYDERAELNSIIDQGENQLTQQNTSINQQIAAFDADVAVFKQKLDSFYSRAKELNRSEELTPEIYAEMMDQQVRLKREGDILNARATELNRKASKYNLKLEELNLEIGQFNQLLKQKPEEGLYNSQDRTITIYYAHNQEELIHTLAHEFGHVLEMEHTIDPESIMYPYVSDSLVLTDEDIEQFDYACREQWRWVLWIKSLQGGSLSKLSGS